MEPVDDADRAFRCTLRPATWTTVAELLEPFETRQENETFQYLVDGGPVLWIISTVRGW
jgi:hypothetical protein